MLNRQPRASASSRVSPDRPAASAPARRPRLAPARFDPVEGLEARRLFVVVAPIPPSASAASLVNQILVPNTGLTVTGGTFISDTGQAGTYTGFSTQNQFVQLAMPPGLLLTTGQAVDAQGPNDSPATSTSLGTAGDPDLSILVGQTTSDANTLSFNFTVAPGTRSILFDFIFGSDEFREFVGSPFNDAFGAYLDGVQVSLDINQRPVTINNNFLRVDNTFNTLDVEYDGLTPRIRTTAPLNPSITNHTLKWVIADTADTAYDSGVFISRLQGSPRILSAPTTELPQPGALTLSQPTYEIYENGGVATILVQRTAGTSGQLTVDYAVTGITATAGADFTGSAGILTFPDGVSTQTLTVPVLDSLLVEGAETVQISLGAPSDGGLGTNPVAVLKILDNEYGVQYLQPTFSVQENQQFATVTVERFGIPADLAAPATINYSATNGTAVSPQDFTTTSGTLSFAPAETEKTFQIKIRNDFEDEPIEAVTLTVDTPTAGGATTAAPALGQRAVAVLNIVNYDRPPTVYNISAYAPRNKIEALFITFNEDMVPESVVDLANYRVFVNNGGKPVGPNRRQDVAMRSASYDRAGKTVTLRPMAPMRQNVFYEVAVRTRSTNGVRSVNGQMLDGNVNGTLDLPVSAFGGFFFSDPFGTQVTGDLANAPGEDYIGYFGRGNRLSYSDRDGSKVQINTAGGGVAEVLRLPERDSRVVRVVGGTPTGTVLSGKVTGRKNANLETPIDELYINGLGANQLPAGFRIGYLF